MKLQEDGCRCYDATEGWSGNSGIIPESTTLAVEFVEYRILVIQMNWNEIEFYLLKHEIPIRFFNSAIPPEKSSHTCAVHVLILPVLQ